MTPTHPSRLTACLGSMIRRQSTARLASVFLLLILPAISILGQQTLLDPTFSGDGKATSQMSEFGSWGNDAALQADGKIVVVGGGFHVDLVRFNTDGTLDSTFDSDGKVITVDPDRPSEGKAIAIQSDGRILVAARSATNVRNNADKGYVIRYTAAGALDTSFSGDGILNLAFGLIDDPLDIAVQPDGKILIIEMNFVNAVGTALLIARFNTDGSLDTTFNSQGYVRMPNYGTVLGSGTDLPKIISRADGKITFTANGSTKVVGQLNPDGTFDQSFGSGGKVEGIAGYGLAVQADGKVLIANRNTFFPQNTLQVVTRLNPDATPDMSFGSAGSATIPFVNQEGHLAQRAELAVQPDGKIVLGGSIRLTPNVTGFDFAVARLNSNGTLDNSFGFNGRYTANISGDDYARAVLLQPDGKIILAGESTNDGFAVARLIPASLSRTCRPVGDFSGDGKSDLAFFNNSFGQWRYVDSSLGGTTTVGWGIGGDRIVPADYNGDCRTDFAVFRNGTWYVKTSGVATELYYYFGMAGDLPVPADYDGDDLADPAVFRNGVWYILGTRDGFWATQFGIAGDRPVNGDYDGDGKDDLAVYRDGVWYIQKSTGGFTIVPFGLGTDKPVVGDYDGDGKSDIAVYRPSDGTWYLLRSSQGFAALRWGISSDVPVPADYDGDGKTDVAVYRDGDWYLLQSTSGYQLKHFAADAGDPIVQNAYVP